MIITSLELSKRLKEAGYPQGNTDFYYVFQRGDWDLYTDCNCDQCWSRYSFRTKADAPIAEEILEKLPKGVTKDGRLYRLSIDCEQKWMNVCYRDFGTNGKIHTIGRIEAPTLTEALGLMYLHLKEHNLL